MVTESAEGSSIDRIRLLEAFDEIARAALAHDAQLEIAVYGGSALMIAGNFRFATEDVDVARIGPPWPEWLASTAADIARRHGWSGEWLNEAVTFHLSALAERSADHVEYGTFPREGPPALRIVVPSAEYMLALKLKAIRILDPAKGQVEADDIFNLMRVLGVDTDAAIDILRRFFPRSAADGDKQRFLLKHLTPSERARTIDAPVYPR